MLPQTWEVRTKVLYGLLSLATLLPTEQTFRASGRPPIQLLHAVQDPDHINNDCGGIKVGATLSIPLAIWAQTIINCEVFHRVCTRRAT